MKAIEQSEFQFTNPLLMEMHFSINTEYLAKLDDDTLNTPLKMNVNRKNAEEPDDNTAFVLLSVDLGEDGADFPYHIAVTMGQTLDGLHHCPVTWWNHYYPATLRRSSSGIYVRISHK